MEEKILPTKFEGYYVSNTGKVFTHWHSKHIKGISGCFSVKGKLREVNQNPRGGNNPNDRYLSVNISLKGENNKTIKQIKYYAHRLIAETFLDNPNDYIEIDHIDNDKTNNHINNLRWISREDNMIRITSKEFKILNTVTGELYEGVNLSKWCDDNWNWLKDITKCKNSRKLFETLSYNRSKRKKYRIFEFQ